MTDVLAPIKTENSVRDGRMMIHGHDGSCGTIPWPEWVNDSHPGFLQAEAFIARHEGHVLRVVRPYLEEGTGLVRFKWVCDPCWENATPQADWTYLGVLKDGRLGKTDREEDLQPGGMRKLRDWETKSTVQEPEYYGVWTLEKPEEQESATPA